MLIIHKVGIGAHDKGINTKREHKKIYIGGAESDKRYRDMIEFGKQTWEFHTKPTIEFLTFDREECQEITHCRPLIETRINKADGVMLIVTTKTQKDALACMEIDCSISNNIPIVGIQIDKYQKKDLIPARLSGKLITFGWEWFAGFINKL